MASKKNRNRQSVIKAAEGKDLILLAGLPRDTLNSIQRSLQNDKSLKPATYYGPPSPKNDWSNLYSSGVVSEIFQKLGEFLSRYKEEDTVESIPTPRRIISLYIRSKDEQKLTEKFELFCYLKALIPKDRRCSYDDKSHLDWRHDKNIAEEIVRRTLQSAVKDTNALKAEITDKSRSALALPACNFYFPDNKFCIEEVYRHIARKRTTINSLLEKLGPARFTRERLDRRAFKGAQHSDYFFQDCRGRVFPPDPYHAPSRSPFSSDPCSEIPCSEMLLVLQQRYRFGVTVRHGSQHYDVQREQPAQLNQEPMRCARGGNILVTGSHANVGVNDVIWVPDGKVVQACNT